MHKTLSAVAATGLSCLLCSTALAQTAPAADANPPISAPATAPPLASATVATTVPPAAQAAVPNGTPIVVEITDLVSTTTAKRDDMFNLKLAEPVMLNAVVAIPAGTPGKGQVIDAAKAGMGGKPGKLVLAARYLELAGQKIPIRGLRMDTGGKNNTGGAVAVSVVGGAVGGLVGLATTGGEVEIQPGTRAAAKLGIDFAPGVPGPAADPAPVPQPVAAAPATTPANTQ